jgi:hypothetical protein
MAHYFADTNWRYAAAFGTQIRRNRPTAAKPMPFELGVAAGCGGGEDGPFQTLCASTEMLLGVLSKLSCPELRSKSLTPSNSQRARQQIFLWRTS